MPKVLSRTVQLFAAVASIFLLMPSAGWAESRSGIIPSGTESERLIQLAQPHGPSKAACEKRAADLASCLNAATMKCSMTAGVVHDYCVDQGTSQCKSYLAPYPGC
jgi:hypothetical protein